MTVVRFVQVSKTFAAYHKAVRGLKAMLISPRSAWRSYRGERLVAVDRVSFEIRQGETVGLIGQNGAGKSTVLALIAGVLRPDSGRVEIEGRVRAILELGAGFHPELTGWENILLNGVLLGLTRREVRARMREIAEFSELGAFLEQPLRTYSSGMAARLGFSVAAHLGPELLLIDEVFAVGDTQFQRKCRAKLGELRDSGVTIVMVSHALAEIREFCSRAIWMRSGRVAADGDAKRVVDEYEQAMLAAG